MDEVTLPAGSRAIVFFGAANRDERKFPDPHKFDVTRNAVDQVAFGSGPHVCIGSHLARLEMNAIFLALASRVERPYRGRGPQREQHAPRLQEIARFRRIGRSLLAWHLLTAF